jgi:hypothetical protein
VSSAAKVSSPHLVGLATQEKDSGGPREVGAWRK